MKRSYFPEATAPVPYEGNGWTGGLEADVLAGKISLEQADERALAAGEPKRRSGRREMLENLVNEFVL